jgi:hypothetical protein
MSAGRRFLGAPVAERTKHAANSLANIRFSRYKEFGGSLRRSVRRVVARLSLIPDKSLIAQSLRHAAGGRRTSADSLAASRI